MEKSHRYLALTMATYSNSDGTSVRPGVVRLALVMEVSHPTVKRSLKWLRVTGFIERVKQGNRWNNEADEYRLTIPDNILDMEMLTPDEEEPPVPSAAVPPESMDHP